MQTREVWATIEAHDGLSIEFSATETYDEYGGWEVDPLSVQVESIELAGCKIPRDSNEPEWWKAARDYWIEIDEWHLTD